MSVDAILVHGIADEDLAIGRLRGMVRAHGGRRYLHISVDRVQVALVLALPCLIRAADMKEEAAQRIAGRALTANDIGACESCLFTLRTENA